MILLLVYVIYKISIFVDDIGTMSSDSLQFDYYADKALNMMENTNNSIFLTWKAGTWKSTLIKYFIRNTNKRLLLLAPTWVAAINIWWSTLHSFFLFHPWITIEEAVEHRLVPKRKTVLENTDCIVIDEVSMLRSDMMDIIDMILRNELKSSRPFAGKQMVFVGDLYQLPPIVRNEERKYFEDHYKSPFFFSANSFEVLNPIVIELQKIYRQDDEQFKWVLNKIRLWLQNNKDLDYLNQRVGKSPLKDLYYISLMTTNDDADKINKQELSKLNTKLYKSKAEIKWEVPQSYYANDEVIEFKPWSQIMMLNNTDCWQNWTIGKLLDYDEDEESALVEIDWEEYAVDKHVWSIRRPNYDPWQWKIINEEIWAFKQLPFKLAWAITIHKSQWLTFDNVLIDFWKRVFAGGQSYVALSRVTSYDWLFLKRELKKADIHLDRRIMYFMSNALILQKKETILEAIEQGNDIRFHYVKSTWEISSRSVSPHNVDNMNYNWYEYIWLVWYCHERNAQRVFNLNKMFDVEIIEK